MSALTVLTAHHFNDLFSECLVECLQQEQMFRFIERVNLFYQADVVLSESAVDLVLIRADGVDSIRAVGELIRANAGLKVLLTGDVNDELLYESVRVGVKGYLPPDISPELFKKALRVVSDGEVWFDRRICAAVIHLLSRQSHGVQTSHKLALLSKREMEILEHLSKGLKNKAIAQALFISESTVKTHLYRIYEKLGVKDRLAAALMFKNQPNSY